MLILVVFKSLAEQKLFLSFAKMVGMKVASAPSFNIEHFYSVPGVSILLKVWIMDSKVHVNYTNKLLQFRTGYEENISSVCQQARRGNCLLLYQN